LTPAGRAADLISVSHRPGQAGVAAAAAAWPEGHSFQNQTVRINFAIH